MTVSRRNKILVLHVTQFRFVLVVNTAFYKANISMIQFMCDVLNERLGAHNSGGKGGGAYGGRCSPAAVSAGRGDYTYGRNDGKYDDSNGKVGRGNNFNNNNSGRDLLTVCILCFLLFFRLTNLFVFSRNEFTATFSSPLMRCAFSAMRCAELKFVSHIVRASFACTA